MSVDSRFIIKYNYRYYQPRIHKGTEADILLVAGDTIYCIECKNFGTLINGKELDLKWHFISRGESNLVANPVLANARHIRTIRGLILKNNIELPVIKNITCVPDTCNIKSPCEGVMKISYFLRLLEQESTNNLDIEKGLYLSDVLDRLKDNVIRRI